MDLNDIGIIAKKAAFDMLKISTVQKNEVLKLSAEALIKNIDFILEENKKDLDTAKANRISNVMAERLTLTKQRVLDMADGLLQLVKLDDPIGEVIDMKTLPNGLRVGRKRVPMGVIGMIYEARPNVTSDAFGLCFKAGSAVILRGGKEAINSNKAIIKTFKNAFKGIINPDVVQLIEDTSRESSIAMMRMKDYIDVLIPRGGAGLIKAVVENSLVPVIETGVGNCHTFVDETAIIPDAVKIIVNAKTQRPSVCNACETLLVHKNIANNYLPLAIKALREKNVVIRGDENVLRIIPDAVLATEEDWRTEYHDYILAVKIVTDIDEAVSHIQKYSTGHSEAIVTQNYTNAEKFITEVDSAAVYVNASTRFTDGNEFGFGAEIGISTQKLHARGPMGLKAITTTKYIIYGNGQIRQ
ncbi:MAG: glutamate-5-semialdehyde dehydrogenase [Clostridiales bacterium]|nr:glutamate-5-semialdehyde dehydrogenase [Clostridiales bacterium]